MQAHETADIGDQPLDSHVHLAGVRALDLFAVDLQPQIGALETGELIRGDQPRAERREGIGALALDPLTGAFELKLALGVVVVEGEPRDV